jgi:hypothetical protein
MCIIVWLSERKGLIGLVHDYLSLCKNVLTLVGIIASIL